MSNTVTGLFTRAREAAEAVRALEARAIPERDVSIVAAERLDRESFGIELNSKAGEGAAIGAGTGGAIGALVAGFTAVGTLSTGGAGLVAAGPIIAAFAGAGAGAAAGGAVGAAVGLAIPEHEVKFYNDALKRGAVLVGVQCDSDERENGVKEIFTMMDADRISHA